MLNLLSSRSLLLAVLLSLEGKLSNFLSSLVRSCFFHEVKLKIDTKKEIIKVNTLGWLRVTKV